MKLLIPLALLATILLSSCSTLANRRELFSPSEPEGEWTKKLHEMNVNRSKRFGAPN